MFHYRPDEIEEARRAAQEEIERLHNFVLNCSPAFVGQPAIDEAKARLAILHGEVYPYQPFGPF